MLAKMGYKQGDAIGRSSSSGIVEPISIQIKTGRGGLGREEAIKQLEAYKEKLRLAKANQKIETSTESISEFRQRMAQKTSGKQLESDLCKCQRACEKLDLDASVEAPAMAFFWPLRKKAELTETVEDPYDDKNEREPKRLRKESSSSDDSEDAITRKQFGQMSDSDKSSSSSSESEEERPRFEEVTSDTPNEDDEYETSEKLEMLTTYLRSVYCYCNWCGVHYKDVEDMEANCPGLTKDDH